MARSVETSRGAMTASEIRAQLVEQAEGDEDFRARLLADPKAILRDDYGIVMPEHLNLYVHEEDATSAHLVLPRSKRLTEAELATVSGGAYY